MSEVHSSSQDFFISLAKRFERLEDELNGLDAATGDGDHGSTILKGLRATAEVPDGAAKAFRMAAGGASGSLFSALIGALEKVITGSEGLQNALTVAADRVGQMGQAKAGDKTMLDALLPATDCSNAGDAAVAARAGADATRGMSASKGRARYVEGAGVGHLDAGAVSVAEILEALSTSVGQAK